MADCDKDLTTRLAKIAKKIFKRAKLRSELYNTIALILSKLDKI